MEIKQEDKDITLYPDATRVHQQLAKLSILGFISILLMAVLRTDIAWWGKGLMLLMIGLLLAMIFYDVRYILGARKHPYQLILEADALRYYNEYTGIDTVNLLTIKTVNIYFKNNFKTYSLLELLDVNGKETNINIAGLSTQDAEWLFDKIKTYYPHITWVEKKGKRQA